jgi:hypothetical protein
MTTPRRLAATIGFGAAIFGLLALELIVGRSAPTPPSDPIAASTRVMSVAAHPTAPIAVLRAQLHDDQLTAIDNALARRDVSAAVRAWHDAYSVALVSGGWQPLIDVGDAFLRIGDAAGTPGASKANARHVYMSALRRAQRMDDPNGVLAVASAFAGLGDDAVATQCAVLAERLATTAGDAVALERVRGFRARYDEQAVVATLDRF